MQILHTNFYPVEPRDELQRIRRELRSKTELEMQYDFLKTIVTKLVKKLSSNMDNNNAERKYSIGGSENRDMKEERAVENLLNNYLYSLIFSNYGQTHDNLISLLKSQGINENFINNYDLAMEFPESKRSKHKEAVDLQIYRHPSVLDATNETMSQIVESWTHWDDNTTMRVAGNMKRMWTSNAQNTNNNVLNSFFSRDYLEMKGNEPIQQDVLNFDIYEEDINTIDDDEKEVRPLVTAVKGNSIYNENEKIPFLFTEVPLRISIPRIKSDASTPGQIAEKAISEKERKSLRMQDFLDNHPNDFKFHPKTFPISSSTDKTVPSPRYPSHFFIEHHKILREMIPKGTHLQAEIKRRNFSSIIHRLDDKDFFKNNSPNATEISHNSIALANDFFTKSMKRGKEESSNPNWRGFSPDDSINAAQSISKAMKLIKSKTPKHDIAKFAIAQRKRFSKKKYKGVENDGERKGDMLAKDMMRQSVKMFNKYRRENATNEISSDMNGQFAYPCRICSFN